MTVFKGACLFSVFSNNFVNESMLSGFSFARFEDSSVRNSTSEYLLWSLYLIVLGGNLVDWDLNIV